MDGERLYLLGHGFTPHFRITYPDGTVRDYSQPFAPAANDPNFTSEGAVKVLDPPGATGDQVRKQQLAIVGIFAPTATLHGGIMTSSFPAPGKPGVAVDIYRGDLGMEGGRSQSVFSIDTAQVDHGLLTKQARTNLMVGESVTLDDGTSITFTGFNEWVSLQTSFDPAQVWALVFSVTMLVGLMVSLICNAGECGSGCGRRAAQSMVPATSIPASPVVPVRPVDPAPPVVESRPARTVRWWRSAVLRARIRPGTARSSRSSPAWSRYPKPVHPVDELDGWRTGAVIIVAGEVQRARARQVQEEEAAA